MKKSILAGSALIAGAAGWALLATSPLCACVPAEHTFARELDLEPAVFRRSSEDMAAALEQAARSKYQGQRLASIEAPKAGREGDCRRLGDSRLQCVYWFEDGLLRRTGAAIDFHADPRSGLFDRAEVHALSRWRF